MTVADAGMRRILLALLAAVLLFGAVSAIGTQGAEAAYPGGSDWIVFENTAGDAELWVVPADGSAEGYDGVRLPSRAEETTGWQGPWQVTGTVPDPPVIGATARAVRGWPHR